MTAATTSFSQRITLMNHTFVRLRAARWCSPRCLAGLATVLFALAGSTAPAWAQLSRVGSNPALIATGVRGNDVAFDPANAVYLVVGSYGQTWGIFVNVAGVPVSAPFVISSGAGFAHYPRVAYSAHAPNGAGGAGGFLVTWHENVGSPNFVHTRMVSFPNRLVSPIRVIESSSTWWESGAAIAYSPVSQLFLVAWRSGDYLVHGARIGLTGAPVGPTFQISASGVGSRDPGVAWSSTTNEFGVVYTGFSGAGATTSFARVTPAGQVIRRNTFNVGAATYIADVAFNAATGHFVAVWAQNGTLGAEITAAGDVVGQGLVSATTGTYDAIGLAYNPVSGTFLLVGQGPSADVWGAELNSRGARFSGDTPLTAAGGPVGSFYPRVAAHTNQPQWSVSFSHNFSMLRNQVIHSFSGAGGAGGSLGGVPPANPGGPSGGCPGSAPFAGAVCVNGGWVPGAGGGGGGTTGGCPGSPPFGGAVCVNGGWVPGTGGGGGGSTGGCPGSAPFAGAVCVNGGWVPGAGGGGGGSIGGCPGSAPFAGAVCVNGGWVPGAGGGGGGSTGGCPGTTPFPGAVCLNGGWVPGAGGGSTGGCPGTAPFAGAVCVNGGWVPGAGGGGGSTGGCPGTAPFPGAVCVNGGWVPGAGGSVASSGCPGTTPFPGAICVNGGWVPGSTASSCTTPDPFIAIGGGICSNGGWSPRR